MRPKIGSEETMRLYKDLAWLWPIISPPESYIDEGELFIRKLHEYGGGKVQHILNLGAGGGHLDSILKRAFKITALDNNPQILQLARKLNPEVEYRIDDLRIARLERKFDAVVIHDAICHMTSLEELRAAFLTAHAHLEPGGVMITFVEEWPEHFVQNRTVVSQHSQGEIEITYIENNYDPEPNDGNYECTYVYLIRREGYLDIQTDRHILGIFPIADWISTLREVGFEVKEDRFELSKSPDATSLQDDFLPMLIGVKK